MHSDLQRIVDDLTEYVGLPIQLTDVRLDSIVFGPHGGEIDWIRRESLLLRRTPHQARALLERSGVFSAIGPLRIPADPDQGMWSRVAVPTRWHNLTYGYLWILDNGQVLTDHQLQHVADVGAEIGRLLHAMQRARHVDASRLSDLVAAPLDVRQRAAAELLEAGIIPPRSPVAAVVLAHPAAEATPDDLETVLWDVGTDALPRAVLRVVESNHTVLLVPLPRSGDLQPARSAAARLRRVYLNTTHPPLSTVVAGISDPQTELVEVHAAYRQAKLAARVAESLPELGPVAEWGRLGAFRALVCIPTDQVGALAASVVRSIMDAGDPSLLPTLEAYLDSGCDMKCTSAFLNVHRGTVYHRLRKVETVSGLHLHDGLDRLALHLSIKLGRLAGLIPHRNGGQPAGR
ncbi:PucR family transcriptional regulator [Micromonospora sp. NPDC005806]|uniref:PucR family transcriptional regulator n=1 Tax=Micromonospora sp. NPDC005806 TaxID=3364234 RepID=UPI003675078C